jgi:hypothetical protein
MREKEERDAFPRASGAVRLTEFDPTRKDGFVNRLNKETTSFFVTNFPEETHVMELWSLFAKHGRVGEVYVPQKRDKRGNRFGFVKFKEVKNLEALCERLEDVWLGSYKLRVNLALFGRNKASQPQNGEAVKKGGAEKKSSVVPVNSLERGHVDKPYKGALLGNTQVLGKSPLPSLEVDVVMEALDVLEGSYVGKMKIGVEVRALQTKLWLAGLNEVSAATMGGGLVLLFRNSGADIGEPARNLCNTPKFRNSYLFRI